MLHFRQIYQAFFGWRHEKQKYNVEVNFFWTDYKNMSMKQSFMLLTQISSGFFQVLGFFKSCLLYYEMHSSFLPPSEGQIRRWEGVVFSCNKAPELGRQDFCSMLQPTRSCTAKSALGQEHRNEDKAQFGKGSSGDLILERRVRTTQHFCGKKYIQHLKHHQKRNGLLLEKGQIYFRKYWSSVSY